MSAHWNLPLSLLDLAIAQARPSSSSIVAGAGPSMRRPNALFRRRAHALALKTRSPLPDVRGGYLRPSGPASSASASSAREHGHGYRPRPTSPKGVELQRYARPTVAGAGIAKYEGRRQRAVVAKTGTAGRRTADANPVALLQDRVESLVNRVIDETETPEELYYAEEELQAFFTDLLAHPSDVAADVDVADEASVDPKRLLKAVALRTFATTGSETESSTGAERLSVQSSSPPSFSTSTPSLAARLAARKTRSEQSSSNSADATAEATRVPTLVPQKVHHSILLRVTDVVQALERAREVAGSATASTTTSAPVAVLSPREWNALVHTCIEENDLVAAEYALGLLKRSGQEMSGKLVNEVADAHASAGNVPGIVALFNKFVVGAPTERQRDLHIKAHLRSTSHEYDVYSALTTLHNYEALALVPPQRSYTRCITALFSARSAQCNAQAWDLFAHMRYVAHPKPDALLYSLMIRACAGTGYSQSAYTAEPARALDLWTEMREDARLPPSVGAYNAVILACARSREHASDAFRLAREMLDSHRDAFGNPLMRPDRATFIALLVAAKTRGDLPRARWILAEMLNMRERDVDGAVDVVLDEKIMVHVFHAYASYVPPFRRGGTKIIDEETFNIAAESDAADTATPEKAVEEVLPVRGRFSVTPPQTPAEVLTEAKTLFERILEDTGRVGTDATQTSETRTSSGAFSQVALNATLLNSYLSVFYSHGSLAESQQQYHALFPRVGIARSLRTHVEALERCAAAARDERITAYAFADEIWRIWIDVARTLDPQTSTARLIERAHVAMIRMTALVNDLNRAMGLVHTFVTRFPPRAVAVPRPKLAMRSTRANLFAPRPLVRLTTPSGVTDDCVPPLLLFQDVELLHHRLVAAGPARRKDIDYVMGICKTYEGALRKRRDLTIRA